MVLFDSHWTSNFEWQTVSMDLLGEHKDRSLAIKDFRGLDFGDLHALTFLRIFMLA